MFAKPQAEGRQDRKASKLTLALDSPLLTLLHHAAHATHSSHAAAHSAHATHAMVMVMVAAASLLGFLGDLGDQRLGREQQRRNASAVLQCAANHLGRIDDA